MDIRSFWYISRLRRNSPIDHNQRLRVLPIEALHSLRALKLVVALVVALLCVGGWWFFNRPAASEGAGTYFRLKAALSYKGQPVGFDIVVGCGVSERRDSSGGSVVEVKGMTARVFAKAIPDGHAISVITVAPSGFVNGMSSPCYGATTANGKVPRDWLPIVVWYDRADDLSHGWGYLTQDAYLRPHSQLAFSGATIEKATRADYDAFVANVPKNLLPDRMADWLNHGLQTPYDRDPTKVPAEIAADPRKHWPHAYWLRCFASARIPIPEMLRSRVLAGRPADLPRLWTPKGELKAEIWKWMAETGASDAGVGRYDLAADPDKSMRATVLPSFPSESLSRLAAEAAKSNIVYDDTNLDDIKIYPGTAFCDRFATPGMLTHFYRREVKDFDRVCRVDGQIMRERMSCFGRHIDVIDDKYFLLRLNTIES